MFIKTVHLIIICCLSVCCGLKPDKQVLPRQKTVNVTESAININTASSSELEKIPHIGPKTANAIVEYREKFGRFRKPEHIMLVPKISDKRFREMRQFIKTD